MSANTSETSSWTIKRLLAWTSEYLQKAEVESPRLCAEILLAHVLECERIDLYVRFDECPDSKHLEQYRELVRRCGQQEPVAYLTGKAHFYGLELEVTAGVLIPRPETEVLVIQALDFIRQQIQRPTLDVLDLCTGSGCVAIALAVNAVEAEVFATDCSPDALQVAQRNIDKHELEGRIFILESNLFDNLNKADKGVFDLIVSNPPYISEKEFDNLAPVVRDYEPKDALLAGPDGLDYHRRIIADAENHLADEGGLILEIAYNQSDEVIALFEQSGYLDDVVTVKDHLGHPRIIKARKK